MKPISAIEGIGPSYADKLRQAGIKTVANLLDAGATQGSRRELAATTGISDKLVLKWVNMADLFRIKGIASQYAELLECSGVDTVKELAQRNPESLHAKMASANEDKKVVRSLPALTIVRSWVSEAKTLPRRVSY